jgi:hypothetical protein
VYVGLNMVFSHERLSDVCSESVVESEFGGSMCPLFEGEMKKRRCVRSFFE